MIDEKLSQRLRDSKLIIFDMDGTICLGERPFLDCVEFINGLNRENKKEILFFTNNTSKNIGYYYSKLIRMGYEVTEKQILSSAEVTAAFLSGHREDKSVYLVGTPYLESVFKNYNIYLTDSAPDIVVSSFDTTLTYEKLERACTYVRAGAEWLSTHPDINCPTENGFIPDSGAINAAISASCGGIVPRYFGKPHAETAEMICELYGADKSEIIVVGDRIYTDIALAKNNGMVSVLVLTGETTRDKVDAAKECEKPDIVLNRASELSELL